MPAIRLQQSSLGCARTDLFTLAEMISYFKIQGQVRSVERMISIRIIGWMLLM